jgi:cytoskeleton protein RodZ
MEAAPAPGEILRKAREARGESLGDVAQILKLSPQQIDALENGRFNVLPGATFVRGFLRNYARHLGIDPEPLLAEINDRIPVPVASAAPIINAMPETARPRFNRVFLMLAIIIILAALSAVGFSKGWFNFRFKSDSVQMQDFPAPGAPGDEASVRGPIPVAMSSAQASPVETITLPPPVPVAMSTLTAILAPASGGSETGAVPVAMAATAPATETAPAPTTAEVAPTTAEVAPASVVKPPPPLRLSFGVNALAEVRDASGRIVFTRMGAKGRSYSAQGKPPFTLKIQQARSVKLEFHGNLIDLEPHINKDGIAHLILQ